MNRNLNEKEILDFYERHVFEDRKGNLSEIRRRLSISENTAQKRKALRRNMHICYGVSCASFLFALLIFGGYRYLLISEITKAAALSTVAFARWFYNIQGEHILQIISFAIAILSACGVIFLICGLQFHIKRKNFK